MDKKKFDDALRVFRNLDYRYNHDEKFIYESLSDLLVSLDDFDMTDCFFRGQSNCEWEVVSSLHRQSCKQSYKRAGNITISALEWLKKNKYLQGVINGNDDYAMAIAQHYGCPTDFVDITASIMTAAYFASSENEKHEETKIGCIWVFPKNEILRLQSAMQHPPKGLLESWPKTVSDKFIQGNRNQLFQLSIPELSRLNAQSGAFLWDVGGILKNQIYFAGLGIRLDFKHTTDEIKMFDDVVGKLFPHPNQLESEIMRILEIRGRDEFGLPKFYGTVSSAVHEKEGTLVKGLLPGMADDTKGSIIFPFPNYFTPSFGEYNWVRRSVTQSNYFANSMDMSKYTECHLPLTEEGARELVIHILGAIRSNTLSDLLIMFNDAKTIFAIQDGQEKDLVNVVINLSNYSFTEQEIAKVILEWVKMQIFKKNNNIAFKDENDFDQALILGYISECVQKYYNCRVTKLFISEGENLAKFWLPENYIFLDADYADEFSRFDKSCYQAPTIIRDYLANVPSNAEIFIYQHKPAAIMPYETMRKIYIDLFLPQLYAFRRIADRLYMPDYIDKIGLPIFGRPWYGISDAINDIDMNKVKHFFMG